MKSVVRFYKELSVQEYRSEAAVPCKRRFERNHNRLFTFLRYDGVPWNNNNAEHAIKAYARPRQLFQGTPTAKAISEYLVLLSVCETCRNKGIDWPEVFVPIAGGWGRMGMTHIRLAAPSEDMLVGALRTACKLRLEKNARSRRKTRRGRR